MVFKSCQVRLLSLPLPLFLSLCVCSAPHCLFLFPCLYLLSRHSLSCTSSSPPPPTPPTSPHPACNVIKKLLIPGVISSAFDAWLLRLSVMNLLMKSDSTPSAAVCAALTQTGGVGEGRAHLPPRLALLVSSLLTPYFLLGFRHHYVTLLLSPCFKGSVCKIW